MSDKKLDLSSILNKQNSPEKKEPEKVEIQDEVIIGDKQESKKEDITEMEEKSETEEAKKINSEFGTLNKQETKIEEKGKDSVLNQVQDDSSE
ncbi:MAG: hypothetical protein LBQ59_00235 [Candidatus Peribacteria bacterium]|jgi:hypothetical protein|nr:hypothetical protein [Candidatus Peribacteria bacterium]